MSLQTGLQIDVTRLALRQHAIDTALISDLQINVPPGIVHTVMGASGSGKSSLLAAVCGTLPGWLLTGQKFVKSRETHRQMRAINATLRSEAAGKRFKPLAIQRRPRCHLSQSKASWI